MADVPPPPPGFSLDPPSGGRRPRSPASAIPPPPPGFRLDGDAVDGDTFSTVQGPPVRLFGADAPELDQQGWKRDLTPVPIGRQAQAIADGLVDPFGEVGTLKGFSYGRPVAPIDQGGVDVGQSLIRSGNALAAPDYLKGDERLGDYMESERLARQNRLGVHGVYAQSPAEFRAAPDTTPDRETVAQFWDTPTPFAGMRPEVEQAYVGKLRTGSAAEIIDFARANGFTLDPADVAGYVNDRDAGKRVQVAANYGETPAPLTDMGDGAVGAAARGLGDGVLPNLLPEVGAVVDAFGGTDNRENVFNSDRRLADIVSNNWRQNEAITGYDDFAHPYARLGGEVAGGLVVPFGAGARTVPQLAKVGGAYGAVAGFGGGTTIPTDLSGGALRMGGQDSLPQRLIGAVGGTGAGALLGAAGGKAIEGGFAVGRRVFSRGGSVAADGAVEGAGGLPREIDRIDIGSLPQRAPDAPAAPIPTARLPRDGRQPDWIDIADVPPPPPGFTLDGNAARAIDPDPVPSISAEPNRPLYVSDGSGRLANETGTGPKVFPSQRDAAKFLASNGLAGEFDIAVGPNGGFVLVAAARDPTRMRARLGSRREVSSQPGAGEQPRQRDYLDMAPQARPLLRDPTETEMRAAAADIEPRDVLPRPANDIGSVEEASRIDAGRIVEAKPPNERDALTKRTVRNFMGVPVPKVGPIDLVGFLRLRGGLKPDDLGELNALGLSNAARRDMDFVGQETRFGPLINPESGSTLDDAAMAAWEAGYFPEFQDRPDINTLLDALRDHSFGQRRRFLPEDLAEVETHAAMRSERFDLERQRAETGEPIYADRSTPADEPAPSAPIEAYEEWPAGGPDFAGNIRLEKLDSPQDIKRALATVNNRVGFDAATRGRVTQAETERLASELGMTPETLLSRRKGQALNAEEALAARQILAKSGNELVNAARAIQRLDNPGDELLVEFRRKLVRHAAIQEQVSGATAESGRALQQFRMVADGRVVRKEVLAALVGRGGGPDRIKDAADILIDAVEGDPGKFHTLAKQMTKPGWQDKFAELYINFLLSFPATHGVNVLSNTLTALGQFPEHAAASVLGGARAAVGRGEDRVLATELGARAVGLLQGTKEGVREFAKTMRTGEPSDFASKIEAQSFHAISGIKGSVIRTPTRALMAEDELFKGMARRMEINGLAVRMAHKEGLRGDKAKARIAELVANPTEEMLERAFDYGRYLTFQRPLGPLAGGFATAKQKFPLLNLIATFVRTPTNLLKFAVERSPAAPLLKEWRADFRAGGARRDLAIARVLVGTGFGAAIYEAALKGHVTGSMPPDEAKGRFMRADKWQPYSFKVGDKFYSYSRLDPFATTIGVAADLATKANGMTPRQLDKYSMLLVASIMKNLADKTWLSGISDFIEAVGDSERYGTSYLRRMAGSIAIPNLVAGTARTIDPVSRDARTVGDQFMARLPGLSDNLPAQRDIWGEPIVNEGGVGPDWLSPIRTSTPKNDPVNAEMLAINARFDVPDRHFKRDGERVDLTPEEYERYAELAGRNTRTLVEKLMASPGWSSRPPEQRASAVKKAATKAKAEARAELFGGGSGKAGGSSPGRKGDVPPPPPGFKVEGESGGRNVYRDLQRAIPGVQFTSGFRDYEYNQRLKARGYNAADNTTHMDGDTLDMLPPPGRSLGWLRGEVKRLYPDVSLLVHDGHLHGRFPGYYGAPVLGGARKAGLRNPFAGMPPPPPGFTIDAR